MVVKNDSSYELSWEAKRITNSLRNKINHELEDHTGNLNKIYVERNLQN